jgi:hypothetical protein
MYNFAYFFFSSLSCIWFILCYESTIGKSLIKSNKNATHAPTSTQTPCNNNLPAHTTTSTPRDKHARKGYCKKKPSKNIFFAKYRHIMLFLQKILFPKKSVTNPLERTWKRLPSSPSSPPSVASWHRACCYDTNNTHSPSLLFHVN